MTPDQIPVEAAVWLIIMAWMLWGVVLLVSER